MSAAGEQILGSTNWTLEMEFGGAATPLWSALRNAILSLLVLSLPWRLLLHDFDQPSLLFDSVVFPL